MNSNTEWLVSKVVVLCKSGGSDWLVRWCLLSSGLGGFPFSMEWGLDPSGMGWGLDPSGMEWGLDPSGMEWGLDPSGMEWALVKVGLAKGLSCDVSQVKQRTQRLSQRTDYFQGICPYIGNKVVTAVWMHSPYGCIPHMDACVYL